MPFTISHSLAIWPFLGKASRYFCPLALIIGSMVPDFHYLLPFEVDRKLTHSLWGLLLWSLPFGIPTVYSLHFFFHPKSVAGTSLKKIISGILLGAASHILWDSLTHWHGFFVQNIPLLKGPITIFDVRLNGFKWAQHFSSLLGLFLLSILLFFKKPPASIEWLAPHLKRWVFIFSVSLVIAILPYIQSIPKLADFDQLAHWSRPVITRFLYFFIPSFSIYALYTRKMMNSKAFFSSKKVH